MVVAFMELRHLRYFVAVAEEENVTRAAARLHVSQPPLTRQIRDLEEELGVALFERNGKSIRLTDTGRTFLGEARASLKRVDEAIRAVQSAARGQQGELHVGYAPSPTVEILPKILQAFQKKWPGVSVVLHDHSSPEMLAALRKGHLHAALMMQPSLQAARGLTFRALCSYPVGIIVAPAHPLSRHRSVTVEQVLAERIVAFSRQEYPDYHEFVRRTLRGNARQLRIAEECDSGPSLIAALASGRGVAVNASFGAIAAGKRVRFVALKPTPPLAVVGIAYRSRTVKAAILGFLEAAEAIGSIQ
jgi:DNA-binding transcriptional LysR family regulator